MSLKMLKTIAEGYRMFWGMQSFWFYPILITFAKFRLDLFKFRPNLTNFASKNLARGCGCTPAPMALMVTRDVPWNRGRGNP